MKNRKLTGPEPATSRPIADPLEGTESVDAGSDFGSAAKGSAIGLEVAGSGPVSYKWQSNASMKETLE